MNEPTPLPQLTPEDGVIQAVLIWQKMIVDRHGQPDALGVQVANGFLWVYALSLDGGYLGFAAIPEPGLEREDGIVTTEDGHNVCHGIVCESIVSKEELTRLALAKKLPAEHFLDFTHQSLASETPVLSRIVLQIRSRSGDASHFSQS